MIDGKVADAYDKLAAVYDQQVHADHWVRRRLWQHYANRFNAGEHILDLAAGTGLDTLFLAHRGVHVTAVDISPEMLAQIRNKVERENLNHLVDIQLLDIIKLQEAFAGSNINFDGIISGFAGLNILSDLNQLSHACKELLRPEGKMIVHMLNRFSLWEYFNLIAHGNWTLARNLKKIEKRIFMIGGQPIQHNLYSPIEAYRQFFSTDFSLESVYSLGALKPPPDFAFVPTPVAKLFGKIEPPLCQFRPFLNWGRFFVLDMVSLPQK